MVYIDPEISTNERITGLRTYPTREKNAARLSFDQVQVSGASMTFPEGIQSRDQGIAMGPCSSWCVEAIFQGYHEPPPPKKKATRGELRNTRD